MLWVALLLSPDQNAQQLEQRLQGLSMYALQYSPRTAVVESAVVVELEASVRLFGGKRALRDRIVSEVQDLGVTQVAWSTTSLAALAFAKVGKENCVNGALTSLLDPLPMEALAAVQPHLSTLRQLGCRTLGDIRALPRAGISRRFDQQLLVAMDQAYGLRPEAHRWVEAPEVFTAKLELISKVDSSPAMLFGARRLLLQMCGWLCARHAGTTSFRLRWTHDVMRERSTGAGSELVVRTASPMRDVDHLSRLLAERLAQVELLAPVGELELQALDVYPVEELSRSLLADPVHTSESLALVLERIAARLGADKVVRPALVEDHRPEWMTQWQPATQPLSKKRTRRSRFPQPSFLLSTPLRLSMHGDKPMYQGVLQLLAGPHRVEGGWWQRLEDDQGEYTGNVARDYWVAQSPHCGVLWVFQERLAGGQTAWYLHGAFA